jgi:hypothetical protein
MNQIGGDQAWQELEKSILLQAITDYVTLKDKGVIFGGDQVKEEAFSYYGNSRHGASRHPMNFSTSKEVKDLIWFLKSSWLDLFCDAIGHKACRVRKRIGLIGGTGDVLTAADLEFYARCAVEKKKRLI